MRPSAAQPCRRLLKSATATTTSAPEPASARESQSESESESRAAHARHRTPGPVTAMRAPAFAVAGFLTLAPAISYETGAQQTSPPVKDLIAQLSASDPAARAKGACELAARGDDAVDAMQPLIALLADASPV